jgi:hypothetical protein
MPCGEGLLRDKDVRVAAQEGIKSVLIRGDIVVLLVPLCEFAEEWCAVCGAEDATSIDNLEADVQEMLGRLPAAWRQLGCVPQLAIVEDVLFKNVALLSAYSLTLPRD